MFSSPSALTRFSIRKSTNDPTATAPRARPKPTPTFTFVLAPTGASCFSSILGAPHRARREYSGGAPRLEAPRSGLLDECPLRRPEGRSLPRRGEVGAQKRGPP